MKIALCTELRNAEWFESRLRSLFAGDGQLVIDELWNEKQLSQALRRSRYHAVVIAMTGARGLEAAIQAKRLAPEVPLTVFLCALLCFLLFVFLYTSALLIRFLHIIGCFPTSRHTQHSH